ncbi:MAG: EI24 domain-containing protein [Bacteroidales bacterium]|nr:EI24 domain-containing protein [Bacteroidales bacterium]
MSLFDGISKSIDSFFKAIPFTFKHFGVFLFVPLLLFILLFIITVLIGDSTYHYISNHFLSQLQNNSDSGWFYNLLSYLLRGILFILFKLLFFFIFFFLSGYIILIILSPLLSYISEKTEKITNNKTYPFSVSIWMQQVGRSLLLSIRNMGIQLLLTILVLILSFIPIIGWILSPFAAIIIFFINAYFFGFSFLDYSFERKGLSIAQSIAIIRKNKGLALGLGMLFYLAYIIPVLGNFLAPFVAIFLVVAATFSVENIVLNE